MTNGKKNVQVRLYRYRNRLKEMAGGAGRSGGGTLSAAALEQAEAEFRRMAEDYPDWVGGYIAALYQEYNAAKEKAPDARTPNFTRINQLAHELKGQGGTFGYPLITTFGKSLHDFTGTAAGTADNHLELVKAHVDAMQVVIKDRVSGEGGELGAELVASLKQAIEKYLAPA